MYIWRDPVSERSTIAERIGERIARIFEWWGLRCSGCGRWCDSTRSISRTLKWGSSAGGLLLMDPFFIKTKVRTCKCGHTMFSCTVVGSESV